MSWPGTLRGSRTDSGPVTLSSIQEPASLPAQKAKWRARRCLLAELADCNSSSGASPPSQLSTITLEDLGLLLEEGLASPELLSLEEISERYEPSCLASTTSVPGQDTPKRWKQLEQW